MSLPYLSTALLLVVTVYAAIVSFRERPKESRPNWLFPNGTSRSARISIVILSLILAVGLVGWFGLSARNSTRPPSRFLVIEGYTGWVRIEYEVAGAPPLPVENGQYILKIPANGLLKTSSPERYGWANDSYYANSGTGVHQLRDSGPDSLIWGKINGEAIASSRKTKYQEFFVGTKSQFTNQPNPEGSSAH